MDGHHNERFWRWGTVAERSEQRQQRRLSPTRDPQPHRQEPTQRADHAQGVFPYLRAMFHQPEDLISLVSGSNR